MEKQIGELLKYAAESNHGIIFLDQDAGEHFLTYQSLYHRALTLLGAMQKQGVPRGSHIVFQLSDNQTFLCCFWCCILGGLIPIPLPVSTDEGKRQKLHNVLSVLDTPYVLTEGQITQPISDALRASERLAHVGLLPFEQLSAETEAGREYECNSAQIAMIQFSSGSTGQPKGVQLTHQNIIANVHSIVGAAGFHSRDSVFSWLPLTHDMGLIGAHLTAVLLQINQYIMPTELFMRRPTLWFDKISEHGVTVTLAPNFAYKYILSLLKSGMQFQWELSKLRFILNGAEPISADVCNQFVHQMGAYGLREDTILNVYGMAEASLAVAFSAPREKLAYTYFDRNSLSIGNRVRLTEKNEESIAIVNVGTAVPDCKIRIADEENTVLEPGTVGEIQLSGPHITCGYYKGGELNDSLFTQDGWLHTGDIGFVYDGKLFISGRFKEILFVNGQNYYPYDIEETIETLMALPSGSVAVCGVPDSALGRDRICVFAEQIDDSELEGFTAEVRKKLMQNMKVFIDLVVPVEKLPRTTSGKIQRVLLKQQVEHNLPAPSSSGRAEIASDRPVTETEALLIAFCKSCLLTDQEIFISRNDSFMAIGLDSVKLLQLAEKISKQFRREVSVTQLFANPTIREMAAFLEGKKIAQMPEISFAQFDRKCVADNSGGCLCFTLNGTCPRRGKQLVASLSDAIQRLSQNRSYSFHCMCEIPGVIDHYVYDGSALICCGKLHAKDLVTAKCCDQNAHTCILLDGEFNRSNHNMIHEYDIVIEYQIQEDQMRFYCYRSAHTEDQLLLALAQELAACLTAQRRKEPVYA